jgi:hypothetical protein
MRLFCDVCGEKWPAADHGHEISTDALPLLRSALSAMDAEITRLSSHIAACHKCTADDITHRLVRLEGK